MTSLRRSRPEVMDYSLYLVTDSTPHILGDRDLVSVVKSAIEGGVTVVQYRDKESDTAELIRVAKELRKITRENNIPFIVNDRVDVALAVGAEGVHVGQDDMDLPTARKLMGDEAIIGVTVSSAQQAVEAAEGGADYLGIGTVYSTSTKQDTKSIIGPGGVRGILAALSQKNLNVPTVCIGNINKQNVQRVLYQSASPGKRLDGVAVVSAIMAAPNSQEASAELFALVYQSPPFASKAVNAQELETSIDGLLAKVPQIISAVQRTKPLNHNMTNQVVQNFAANVALAVGSSPIMSLNGLEAQDLAQLGGSLVINMGTVTAESLDNYVQALQAYNATGNPVLFDPVGGGATAIRRMSITKLLRAGFFDFIKGNGSEITAVIGESNEAQHGVDSSSSMSPAMKAKAVQSLAIRERNIVLMTGSTDYISDGQRTFAISNGHPYLGKITGSGCSLGTVIAAFLAVERTDKLLASVSGVLLYEIAAEHAAGRDDVRGPGTFVPAFIDELSSLSKSEPHSWLGSAKLEHVETT